VLISNNFYTGKTPKLAPSFKGPSEIIDINDTNAKVKIGIKIKVLNVNKLKLFIQELTSDRDTSYQELNFNDEQNNAPITRACGRLINFKNAMQLALLMLNEEVETNIDSLCDGPCARYDSENDYFKLNLPQRKLTKKCAECKPFAKLFIKLKEQEDQCNQLKRQINFACQHKHHQINNQIKSVETQLKTCIAESLHEPLMKIAHKLLIRDNSTLEELTYQEQQLWNRFKTDNIYCLMTGEPDMVPVFCFNWTSIPRLQPLGHITTTPATPAPGPVPAQQQQLPQAQQPPSDPSSSGSSSSSSSPHSLPTPSMSGTQPKSSQPTTPAPSKTDPSGASTSGTTPPAKNTSSRNLREQTKVNYKDLHTGASQFGREQFRK